MGIWNLIFNRKKFKKPAKINIKNIKGYLQGNLRYFMDFTGIIKPEEHILEQVKWRLHKIKENSPLCLEYKSCINCGCSVIEKVYEDRACEGDCYPIMKNKEDWEDFKLKNNINIEKN